VVLCFRRAGRWDWLWRRWWGRRVVVLSLQAEPPAQGPGRWQHQPSAVVCQWMENHFPSAFPMLCGAFPGYTRAQGAAACVGLARSRAPYHRLPSMLFGVPLFQHSASLLQLLRLLHQPLPASPVAPGTCVLEPCIGSSVEPLLWWGQLHGCPCSLSAAGGAGPALPPVAPCLSPWSFSSLEVSLPRCLGCLPFRNRGGGNEQANFFHVYNRVEECFWFMAAVIAR